MNDKIKIAIIGRSKPEITELLSDIPNIELHYIEESNIQGLRGNNYNIAIMDETKSLTKSELDKLNPQFILNNDVMLNQLLPIKEDNHFHPNFLKDENYKGRRKGQRRNQEKISNNRKDK